MSEMQREMTNKKYGALARARDRWEMFVLYLIKEARRIVKEGERR